MSTVQPIAWSHSRVNTFLDCPKMFYHQNILKDVKYEQGEPQKEGERAHKALELRLTRKVDLPKQYAKYEMLIRAIESLPGITYGERDLALDDQLRPTGYFEKNCYVRVTADVININGNRGIFLDYKNGKVSVDEAQLKLYAAVGFHVFPEIEQWETKYIFLQHDIVTGDTYTRGQLPALWEELLPVPRAIQKAVETNNWPPSPGRKCGWCSVNKAGKCPSADGKYRGD